jgi:hypothetical protein
LMGYKFGDWSAAFGDLVLSEFYLFIQYNVLGAKQHDVGRR